MSDIISWEKAIDKKVKSSDNHDLGKIESITREYIQTKEGVIGKKYYFIPKYYIQGYDGDNLWVSLTKDEVKTKFERETPPDLKEFETSEYAERKSMVIKQYSDFDNSIPSYSSSTSSTRATSASAQQMPGGVEMSWDKIIDKKVKSSDRQDLGKVESVSTEYIEVKEGLVSKKHYYIPKYYIEGFDGEHLHTSLTKDEIKAKYERDSPPAESEFRTEEYMNRKRKVEENYPQFLHGIPFMSKEPGVTLQSNASGGAVNIPWEEIIHKRVKTTDNVDIGDVEKVGNEFIVVREGVAKIHLYYIPKSYINNYDGSALYVDAPSGLVSAKFERDTEPTPEEIRKLSEEQPKKSF
jgi:hypothetical protein